MSPTEYNYHPQLGFISINTSLQPEDVLAVSFEYTVNGKLYKVGEFTDNLPPNVDTSNVMFLKMFKSASARTDLPIWDLMMKNVYSTGGFPLSQEDFKLDVLFQDPGGGFKRYIPADYPAVNGVPLIQLMNLDRLNNNNDPQRDGIFDFVSGVTILPSNGKIIFPVLEPFGDHIRNIFEGDEEAGQFVYDQLYDQTKFVAEQFPQFNRYVIRGSYKSSISSEIYLGAFNLPRNSVRVTAEEECLQKTLTTQ